MFEENSEEESKVFAKAKKAILDKSFWKLEGKYLVTDFKFEELGDRTAPAMTILFEEMGIEFSVAKSQIAIGATIKLSLLPEQLYLARAKLNGMEL